MFSEQVYFTKIVDSGTDIKGFVDSQLKTDRDNYKTNFKLQLLTI